MITGIIVGLVIIVAVLVLMKLGKIKDTDNDFIPDAIEDKVEDIKEEVEDRIDRVKEELGDVADASKNLIDQVDDIPKAAGKRRGRKKKK